jgi:CubicO group peptidase (beta-lactamase class C family)
MFRSVFLPVAIIVTQIISCKSQTVKTGNQKSFSVQLDSLVPALLKEHSVPGISLAVIREGKIYWAKAYGHADILNNKRADEETIFNIGSVSKTITAWGVMKLAEEKKINLDSPVV